jgi:hypothetical protein
MTRAEAVALLVPGLSKRFSRLHARASAALAEAKAAAARVTGRGNRALWQPLNSTALATRFRRFGKLLPLNASAPGAAAAFGWRAPAGAKGAAAAEEPAAQHASSLAAAARALRRALAAQGGAAGAAIAKAAAAAKASKSPAPSASASHSAKPSHSSSRSAAAPSHGASAAAHASPAAAAAGGKHAGAAAAGGGRNATAAALRAADAGFVEDPETRRAPGPLVPAVDLAPGPGLEGVLEALRLAHSRAARHAAFTRNATTLRRLVRYAAGRYVNVTAAWRGRVSRLQARFENATLAAAAAAADAAHVPLHRLLAALKRRPLPVPAPSRAPGASPSVSASHSVAPSASASASVSRSASASHSHASASASASHGAAAASPSAARSKAAGSAKASHSSGAAAAAGVVPSPYPSRNATLTRAQEEEVAHAAFGHLPASAPLAALMARMEAASKSRAVAWDDAPVLAGTWVDPKAAAAKTAAAAAAGGNKPGAAPAATPSPSPSPSGAAAASKAGKASGGAAAVPAVLAEAAALAAAEAAGAAGDRKVLTLAPFARLPVPSVLRSAHAPDVAAANASLHAAARALAAVLRRQRAAVAAQAAQDAGDAAALRYTLRHGRAAVAAAAGALYAAVGRNASALERHYEATVFGRAHALSDRALARLPAAEAAALRKAAGAYAASQNKRLASVVKHSAAVAGAARRWLSALRPHVRLHAALNASGILPVAPPDVPGAGGAAAAAAAARALARRLCRQARRGVAVRGVQGGCFASRCIGGCVSRSFQRRSRCLRDADQVCRRGGAPLCGSARRSGPRSRDGGRGWRRPWGRGRSRRWRRPWGRGRSRRWRRPWG